MRIAAVWVVAVRKSVEVIIATVVALFGRGRASRVKSARRIGAIDQAIAVFIDTTCTDLGDARLASCVVETSRISAIDQPITIVVPTIGAGFVLGDQTQALRVEAAVRIRAIDQTVAILIRSVRTILGACLANAGGVSRTIIIGAVDQVVAIVVPTVLAGLRFATTIDGPHAVCVQTVHSTVAVIVARILADFPVRSGRTTTLAASTRRVKTVRNAIAIVVSTICTIFDTARMRIRVQIVAVRPPTQAVCESVLILITDDEDADAPGRALPHFTRVARHAVRIALACHIG